MAKRLPLLEKELMRARRKVCRKVASVLIRAMAETDSDFAFLAMRLGKPEDGLRKWLYSLIDGTAPDFDRMSDLALAMGYEFEFHLVPYQDIGKDQQIEPTAESGSKAA